MHDVFFVLGLAIFFMLLFGWAFRTLPNEKWQIMASVPIFKEEEDLWRGLNLTYYGLFTAIATVASAVVILVLMAAVRVEAKVSLAIAGLILAVCFPAAKVIARVVEKKPHTLTIGGAFFVGIIVTPAIVWFVDGIFGSTGHRVPILPALASIAIAYGLGEGLGRLACISFGCCYGKPLAQCGPRLRWIFGRHFFIFSGKTKKIAYEGALDGAEVVPIQAVTAVFHVIVSLVGIFLFLKSYYSIALIVVILVTQSWRALSETLRADYRGTAKISAYQIMSLLAIPYAIFVVAVLPSQSHPTANLAAGAAALWDPAVIMFLEALGLIGFLYSGRSMVTSSKISFHVLKDKI
jgi:Prolipoprotein diacylglyceryl transferase